MRKAAVNAKRNLNAVTVASRASDAGLHEGPVIELEDQFVVQLQFIFVVQGQLSFSFFGGNSACGFTPGGKMLERKSLELK